MKYFDTHAHYYDNRFSEECDSPTPELIARLFDDNVSDIVNVATSPLNYDLTISQAQLFARMYTALGIHPCDSQSLTSSVDHYMEELYQRLKDAHSKAVALGEIGLDYHYDDTNKEVQLAFFHAQMDLAKELDLPVVIHDRDAHGDVMDVISAHPGVRGIMHSFSGSAEMAKDLVRCGYYISFSGTITFKGARKTVESAKILPHSHVLIETDCPYLSPVPFRGKLNHSGHLVYTNAALAECLSLSAEECAALTAENARTIFKLS